MKDPRSRMVTLYFATLKEAQQACNFMFLSYDHILVPDPNEPAVKVRAEADPKVTPYTDIKFKLRIAKLVQDNCPRYQEVCDLLVDAETD